MQTKKLLLIIGLGTLLVLIIAGAILTIQTRNNLRQQSIDRKETYITYAKEIVQRSQVVVNDAVVQTSCAGIPCGDKLVIKLYMKSDQIEDIVLATKLSTAYLLENAPNSDGYSLFYYIADSASTPRPAMVQAEIVNNAATSLGLEDRRTSLNNMTVSVADARRISE